MKENMMFYGVTLSQRYTLKQKECFLEEVIKKCKDNGYKTSFISKHGSYYQLANLVIGDLDKAKTIVCASYDTPRKSLIPVNYYPFAAKNNVSMGKKNVIVDAVIMIIMFLLSYVILLNFNEASTSIKSLKIIMLAVLIIFTFFVLKGTANKVNFSRNSAAVAMVMELMENNQNSSVAYVLLDRNTVTYEGLKALKEKLQDTSKEIILLDALAYGNDTCIAYNKNVDISDFKHDTYILKEYQNPTNALQYFKNMIQISCGDIEDHMFVVKNTCTNKDYEIDMNRLEEIYQLLMTHINRR